MVVIALVGCRSAPEEAGPRTVRVEDQTVPVARFTGALDALCQARIEVEDHPGEAERIYREDAQAELDLIVRALRPTSRLQAEELLAAKRKVEADFARPSSPVLLFLDLGALAEATTASLVRLAIPARPCAK
jgi:hypothetical protein